MTIVDIHGRPFKQIAPMAHWKAGKPGNRAFGDSWGNPGPNLANLAYLNLARARARDAVRNAAWATRAVEIYVTDIIGTGIKPVFSSPEITELYERWEDECDSEGIRDIYGCQESVTRAWAESGEVFVRYRYRRPEDGLSVPLQVEILEADMLPLHDMLLQNGNRVVQGIELNGINRRVAYWFYRDHPSDGLGSRISTADLVRVPAESVAHIYEPLRPGQLRGFPKLATSLMRIQQLNDFDEATLERQKAAAALTFAIIRPQPTAPGIDPLTGLEIGTRSASEVSPGSAYEMLPGEDIKSLAMPSLGGEYEAFSKVQIRAISSSLNIPYELIANDFSGMSDRTVRVLINEYRRRIEQHQWNRIVRQFMRPFVRQFLDVAVLSGAIDRSVNRTVRYQPPAWPYFHPVQDVQAIEREIKAGLRSRQDAIHSRGNDPRTVLEERIQDRDEDAGAGLYTSTYVEDPKVARQGAERRANDLNRSEVKRNLSAARASDLKAEHYAKAALACEAQAERDRAEALKSAAIANRENLEAKHESELQALIKVEREANIAAAKEESEYKFKAFKIELDNKLSAMAAEVERANAIAAAAEARADEKHKAAMQAIEDERKARDARYQHELDMQQKEREAAERALVELQQ